MESIIVTIPAQKWDCGKYTGFKGRCYLEEALDRACYQNVSVSGDGITTIGNKMYEPKEAFNADVCMEKLIRNESITVELIPIEF